MGFTSFSPSYRSVIPAKAGIQYLHMPSIEYLDSGLRRKDGKLVVAYYPCLKIKREGVMISGLDDNLPSRY